MISINISGCDAVRLGMLVHQNILKGNLEGIFTTLNINMIFLTNGWLAVNYTCLFYEVLIIVYDMYM